ncbi:hypothetical protein JGUZn3_10740 [Entomobacter blattae]|uniref:Uncharacterized protein n=1 Tax=Entomobacter blattae TaxID=2762277 RepID=A0A7H1NR92_9PROT|nr:hypothetical protein JGUZn3_10740 [Entomobacter blattae]
MPEFVICSLFVFVSKTLSRSPLSPLMLCSNLALFLRTQYLCTKFLCTQFLHTLFLRGEWLHKMRTPAYAIPCLCHSKREPLFLLIPLVDSCKLSWSFLGVGFLRAFLGLCFLYPMASMPRPLYVHSLSFSLFRISPLT